MPKSALEATAFGGIILLCLVPINPEGLASGAALGSILPVVGLFAIAGQRLMPELQTLYQSLARLQASAAAVDIVHDDLVVRTDREVLPHDDADLIVFDEATSALDNLADREVMAATDTLPIEKTVLMIAHRLSTVQRCGRIVVMEQGRVVGCDSWAVLMAENTAFQRIARTLETA